ncbi:MAG TPA: hypothetical protein VN665_01190 [Candidatus Paceibacterota bacterium]|nr:hypothetical protein [Candidatus Paceibacterota bacterium]
MTAKKEPSNADILEGMNKRFNMVFTELKKNDARFDLAYRQLTNLDNKITDVQKTQTADGELLEEMQTTLNAVAKAVDADAMTIINHEARITKLEPAVN